jgi:hypothetical protein
MSLFYSIKLPENIIKNIKDSSDCLIMKSGRDIQLKFEKDKYSPHITFIYFGDTLNSVTPNIRIEIDNLIKNTEINNVLEFYQVSLFGRFVVVEYKFNSELIKIKEKLIKNIVNILLENNCDPSIFMSKNNYLNGIFTRIWQPHITIGGIRTPSIDYCNRKGFTVDDCVNGCFMNIKRYIEPILIDMSFSATSVEMS